MKFKVAAEVSLSFFGSKKAVLLMNVFGQCIEKDIEAMFLSAKAIFGPLALFRMPHLFLGKMVCIFFGKGKFT